MNSASGGVGAIETHGTAHKSTQRFGEPQLSGHPRWSTLPLANEPEIKARHAENERDNEARAADLRRLHNARTQWRCRHAGHVEIKQNPRAHEKGACQKLAHLLPWNSPKHVSVGSYTLPPALAHQDAARRRAQELGGDHEAGEGVLPPRTRCQRWQWWWSSRRT